MRRLNDMPAGTIGFEAVGEVEDDDWERSVEPRLRTTIAGGDRLRLLFLLGPRSGDLFPVLEGLAPGEKVAATGVRCRPATP